MAAARSLWLQEALLGEEAAETPELLETIEADVCIVGGGYTGLWTALRIKELQPDTTVVLLEADICGGGPSGRNGGFALSWWPKIETLQKRLGKEEALRLVKASVAAIAEIGEFCEREGVDAHFHQGGWVWTATSPAQVGSWEGAVAAAEAYGEHPFELLTAEEVQARTGSPVHLGAAYEKTAATVQPALLARGLRRVALERGVRIYERTAMIDLEREAGAVRTPSGAVRAGAVVLALNAWAIKIRELSRALVAVASDMVATAPMPERLAESAFTLPWRGLSELRSSRTPPGEGKRRSPPLPTLPGFTQPYPFCLIFAHWIGGREPPDACFSERKRGVTCDF